MVITNNLPFAPPGRAGLPGDADFTGIPGSPTSRIECTVVHVVPGRVRLRAALLRTSAGLARQLILQLDRHTGAARTAFLRWVRSNERVKGANEQPLLSVVHPAGPAMREFACAA